MIVGRALAVVTGTRGALIVSFVLAAEVIAERKVVVRAVKALALRLGVGRLRISK